MTQLCLVSISRSKLVDLQGSSFSPIKSRGKGQIQWAHMFFAQSPPRSFFLENKTVECAVAPYSHDDGRVVRKEEQLWTDRPSFEFSLRKKTKAELTQFSHSNQISVSPLSDTPSTSTLWLYRRGHWGPERRKDIPKVNNKSVTQLRRKPVSWPHAQCSD